MVFYLAMQFKFESENKENVFLVFNAMEIEQSKVYYCTV